MSKLWRWHQRPAITSPMWWRTWCATREDCDEGGLANLCCKNVVEVEGRTGTVPEKMPQSGPSARTPRTRRRRPVALTKPAWGHCRPKQNSTFTGCAGVNGTTDPSKVHTINFALLLSFCHRAASYLDPLAQTSKQLRRHCWRTWWQSHCGIARTWFHWFRLDKSNRHRILLFVPICFAERPSFGLASKSVVSTCHFVWW